MSSYSVSCRVGGKTNAPGRNTLGRAVLRIALGMLLVGGSQYASAANWVMLLGTEPKSTPALKPFGFLGVQAHRTDGSRLPAGPWQGQSMVLNQIAPDLDRSSQIQLSHARIGARGRLLDGRLNYWASGLFGNNGISHYGDPNGKVTDLSVTVNWIPHARVRLGQFKYPGSEEGLQPAVLRDYVNTTNVTNQIVNERFFNSDGTPTDDANEPDGPVSGWRDTGLQVFDSFNTGPWEHTYAVMAGTGSGLALYRDSGSGQPEWFLFWSSEWVFSGKGPNRDGFKVTAWHQQGERTLRAGSEQTRQTFERERFGVGSTYRRGPWRASAEWVKARGMIFNGTDAVAVPGSISNDSAQIASFNLLPEEDADGWYVDGGYTLLDRWELRARYDRLNRATVQATNERRFETLTVGVTYRLNKHLRILADYEFRDIEAPGLDADAVPNRILDNLDDRLGIQLWARF